MKVFEVIQELQNFPMDMEVECLSEDSDWRFNGESSEEVTVTEEGSVVAVEKWTNRLGEDVVRIS